MKIYGKSGNHLEFILKGNRSYFSYFWEKTTSGNRVKNIIQADGEALCDEAGLWRNTFESFGSFFCLNNSKFDDFVSEFS